jgi:hypothetical protein
VSAMDDAAHLAVFFAGYVAESIKWRGTAPGA